MQVGKNLESVKDAGILVHTKLLSLLFDCSPKLRRKALLQRALVKQRILQVHMVTHNLLQAQM